MQMFGVEHRLPADPSEHCSLLYILGLQVSREGAGRLTQPAKYRVDVRHFLAKLLPSNRRYQSWFSPVMLAEPPNAHAGG